MKEENQSSKLTKMKANLQKVLKKRWVLPAVYLGLVAVVLTTVIWLQGVPNLVLEDEGPIDRPESNVTEPNHQEAVPVAVVQEQFQMPVTSQDDVQVVGYFFDVNAPREEQLAALVQYDNNWFESKGIDLALESGESFEVVAALSGTVIKSEKDALVGNTVRIEHENNLVTVYQSLEGVVVKEGQSIKQGEMVGKAGRNLYNQDAGVHVHFQVHQDQVPVNPMNFIDAQAEERNAEEQERFNNQLAQ